MKLGFSKGTTSLDWHSDPLSIFLRWWFWGSVKWTPGPLIWPSRGAGHKNSCVTHVYPKPTPFPHPFSQLYAGHFGCYFEIPSARDFKLNETRAAKTDKTVKLQLVALLDWGGKIQHVFLSWPGYFSSSSSLFYSSISAVFPRPEAQGSSWVERPKQWNRALISKTSFFGWKLLKY